MIQEQRTELKKQTALTQFRTLAIKVVILIAAVRIGILFFEIFAVPSLGIGHSPIIIGETMATIVIAFVVIYLIRNLLKRIPTKIPSNLIASISFFSIIIISLVTLLILLYIWGVQPQTVLLGGGVAAIIIGIGLSTIVGNIFSGALMLTTYPAKIGDAVFIITDNIHGTIKDITTLYTKVSAESGREYLVPNSAIIQGFIRIAKEESLSIQLPYFEGDIIEVSNGSQKLAGLVIKIAPRATTILDDEEKEVVIPNRYVLNDNTIIKKISTKNKTTRESNSI